MKKKIDKLNPVKSIIDWYNSLSKDEQSEVDKSINCSSVDMNKISFWLED